ATKSTLRSEANRPWRGESSQVLCSQPPTTQCQSPNPKHKKVKFSEGKKTILKPIKKNNFKESEKHTHTQSSSPFSFSSPRVTLKLPLCSVRPHRIINPPLPAQHLPPRAIPIPQSPRARAPNPLPLHLLRRFPFHFRERQSREEEAKPKRKPKQELPFRASCCWRLEAPSTVQVEILGANKDLGVVVLPQ
ncbi:hypothetical protein EJB05_04771, partial [Eragrostis curvula]